MTTDEDPKATLKRYLQSGREALLWKLEGLDERRIRWPMTATGTNLLGLVKHVASTELSYFTEVFGKPVPEPMPWMEPEAEDNADMWAVADQSRAWVIDFYRRVWEHSDRTIDELELDAPGQVPWWRPASRDVTLQQMLVHMITETARHAGHADIVRELTDSEVGMTEGNDNIPPQDEQWWADYLEQLRRTAEEVGGPAEA